MGAPLYEATTGKLSIGVSKAIVGEDGSVLGVVAMDISLGTIQKLLHNIQYNYAGEMFIINDKNIALVYPEKSRERCFKRAAYPKFEKRYNEIC
ncbi:cache domain-containing protein [Bacillus cytotoxicus]